MRIDRPVSRALSWMQTQHQSLSLAETVSVALALAITWLRLAVLAAKRRVRVTSTGVWTCGAGLFSSAGRSDPGQPMTMPETVSISRSVAAAGHLAGTSQRWRSSRSALIAWPKRESRARPEQPRFYTESGTGTRSSTVSGVPVERGEAGDSATTRLKLLCATGTAVSSKLAGKNRCLRSADE